MRLENVPLDSYESFTKYCETIPSFHEKNSNGVVCWSGPDWLTLSVIETILFDIGDAAQNPKLMNRFLVLHLTDPSTSKLFYQEQNEILKTLQKIKGLEKHQFQYGEMTGVDGKKYSAVYLVSQI
jgi:hypothetical protein